MEREVLKEIKLNNLPEGYTLKLYKSNHAMYNYIGEVYYNGERVDHSYGKAKILSDRSLEDLYNISNDFTKYDFVKNLMVNNFCKSSQPEWVKEIWNDIEAGI